MADSLETRYNIGDKLHVKFLSEYKEADLNFSIEVEILGIGGKELAERYESVIVNMFNIPNFERLYQDGFNDQKFYYICGVLKETESYNIGDLIILTDSIIDKGRTYYLNQKLNIYIDMSFSNITHYKSKEDAINDIEQYLRSKQIPEIKIYEELSYQEKLDHELNEYRSIINSLKNLKSLDQLIDKVNSCFNTLVVRINSLIEKINSLFDK